MNRLADESVVPAKKGAPAIGPEEAQALLAKLPGWSIVNDKGTDKLTKQFKLPDYRTALILANKVAAIAEQADHHPAILLEWGKVTVTWWTHTIGGLHRNDFIMAARCDRAALLITAP